MEAHELGYRLNGVRFYPFESITQRFLSRLPKKRVGSALCAKSTPRHPCLAQTLL